MSKTMAPDGWWEKIDDMTPIEVCTLIAELEHLDANEILKECVEAGDDFISQTATNLMFKHGVERGYESYDQIGWHYRVFDNPSPIVFTCYRILKYDYISHSIAIFSAIIFKSYTPSLAEEVLNKKA